MNSQGSASLKVNVFFFLPLLFLRICVGAMQKASYRCPHIEPGAAKISLSTACDLYITVQWKVARGAGSQLAIRSGPVSGRIRGAGVAVLALP